MKFTPKAKPIISQFKVAMAILSIEKNAIDQEDRNRTEAIFLLDNDFSDNSLLRKLRAL